MKINNLKINGFGKIENKEINLENKINIIYGKNESGKSTIFNFIVSMLYGCSKLKKGKNISNFEKYKPWNTEEFSGKIKYELDNNKKYEIIRKFKSKNPIIYNENSEDISKQFNNDKTKGINYFYEQTGIDEDLFISTTAVAQEEIKLEKNNENLIIQKITNIASTGEDNTSYKNAINKLNKKQLNEIGTSRSNDRPINKIEKELNELKIKKNNLNNIITNKENLEIENNKIKTEINNSENKIEIIKNIKEIIERNKIENEKINLISENILNYEKEIDNFKNEKKKISEKTIKETNNKNNKLIIEIISLILSIIIFISGFVLENNIIKIITLIPTTVFIVALCINIKNKKEIKRIKENNKTIKKEEININNKIEIIEKNIKDEKLKKELLENKIKNIINIEKEKIKNKYNSEKYIEELFLNNNIENIYEKEIKILNENKLQLHKLEIEKNNMEEKLNNLILIDEKINYLEEQYKELMQKNESIEFAKNILEKAYIEMKQNVTPKFIKNLSEIIKEISDNKYEEIKFNNEDGLIVEKENGEYVSVDKLSVGTIDQLYLAFRLSIIKEISEEKIPIILDEAFAYYDEKRLENILKYLSEKIDNQIIIFTCTQREKNILNKLNIKYNYNEI